MDIEGLGPAIIETFVNVGMINKTYDIYNLDPDKIASLEGFKQTSAKNIINSVNNSKKNDLSKLIFALGIRHIGAKAGKLLADHFKNIDAGGHGQGAHEFAELGHINGYGIQFDALAHGVGKGVGAKPGETVIDDFKHGHAPANDPLLAGETIALDAARLFLFFRSRLDLAGHDSAHQGIDFFLGEYLVHAILEVARLATG